MVTIEQVLALNPCYPRDRIEELMRLDPYEALCGVPHADARWVLVRLMPADARVAWARACARRATEYAPTASWAARAASEAAADAASEAAAASWAAASAARAEAAASAPLAWAADAASEEAARAAARAEHHIAIRHALILLGVSHSG